MRIIENIKKHKLLVFILISLFAVCCGLATYSSVAWFARQNINTDEHLSGGAITNYFHVGLNGNQTDYVGDGEENPFIITLPKHYYNLVNLYQKVSDYSDQHYYFQVGAKLKGENGGFWVYDVDENGQMQKAEVGYTGDVSLDNYKISKTLDMSCYGANEPLLPIGTHDKNFLSTFEGNGLTLANFTVKWEGDSPTCDVGIFGYVGPGVNKNHNFTTEDGKDYPVFEPDEVTKIQNVYFKNVVIDVSNVSISNISDFSALEETAETSKTKTHTAGAHDILDSEGNVVETVAYVGSLAGHVVTAVDIKNVFLDEITLKGASQALSHFGYFGCIEDEKGNVARSIGEAIGIEFSSGNDVGWGGSLDMLSLFNRLQDVHNYTDYKSRKGNGGKIPTSGQFTTEQTFLTKYVSNEIIVNINDEQYRTGTRDTIMNFVTNGDGYTYSYYQSGDNLSGSYYFEPDTWSSDTNWYMALFGESSLNKKSITTYTAVTEGGELKQYSAFLIQHGENGAYLTVNGSSLVGETQLMGSEIIDFQMEKTNDQSSVDAYNALTLSISQKWILDNGKLYAIVDGNIASNSVNYYLNKNANNSLSISTTPSTSTWAYDDTGFYCTENNVKYYLVYTGSEWTLVDGLPTVLKTADGQNYLSVASNNNVVSIVNSTTPTTIWYKQYNGNVYFTIINGARQYLYCNGDLGVTTTAQNATNWTVNVNNNFSTTFQGVDYGIVFTGSVWKTMSSGTVVKFDNTHYLVLADNGTMSNSATKDNATLFQLDASNRLYVIRNGAIRYVTINNGNVALSATATNVFTLNGANNFVATQNGTSYYLTYSNGWKISSNQAYAITDGTNYLQINGTNSFANTTSVANSAPFLSLPTGSTATSITTILNGVTYYLTVSNNKLALQTTADNRWTFASNRFVYNSTYYLVYDTKWQVVRAFTARSGNYYMIANSDTALGRNRWTSTTWYMDEDGYLYTYYNNANRYLYRNGTTLNMQTTKSLTWSIDTSNRLRSSDGYYVRYANSSPYFTANTATSNAATVTTTTPGRYTSRSANVGANQTLDDNLNGVKSTQDIFEPILASVETVEQDIINTKSNTTRYSFTKSIDNNNGSRYNGGYNNYIPLRIAEEGEINGVDENGDPIAWTTEDDPFRVSVKNTGYIVGGAKIVDSSQSAAQKEAGDIRISGFPISRVGTSYTRTGTNQGEFTNVIRTVGMLNTASNGTVTASNVNLNLEDASGNGAIRKGQLANYESTKEKLLEILKDGNDRVYGLHFMDAQISMSRKIIAPKALVSGAIYENYELPQDCIDFTVNTQNYISFFAGSYYANDGSFFSLHRIVRDEETGTIITAIKEIKAIYGHKTAKETNPYIYVYNDNTMEKGQKNNAGKTVYSTVNSIPNDYAICFDMTWITRPSGNGSTLLQADQAIYYFEVPCNPGEYALGSVSGSDGEYLIYLDIGTNGGDAIKTKVSGLGNGLTANFYVDDRVADYGANAENDVFVFDANGKIAEGSYSQNSLIQYSVEKMPTLGENETFEVKLSFNKNNSDVNYYPEGLYTVAVTNTANLAENVEIMIVLCDNDHPIEGNDFYPYAYNVTYNGNVVANVYSINPETNESFTFFKSFVKLIIKPDGTYELSEEVDNNS